MRIQTVKFNYFRSIFSNEVEKIMDEQIKLKAESWLKEEFDEDTRATIHRQLKENPDDLADAFYRSLEFGTGGLRGLMGVGTNRMNKYTVGMATQGYANYLKNCFPGQVKVA